ncbi:PLP-dependent aminotransferase family protein [Streptomyces sp. NPDC090106]|uniref:MocR-like pyridoxine biosynthesis transcription factor PdxR n=1 Tax=Streptomyces sp. NPDC090106 TaxID=3365946 RepID=UPI0038154B7F
MTEHENLAPLRHDSSEPLYQQVRRRIESILVARSTAARPLPSSRYLAAALGVSRNTVNVAYDELIALGLVEARPRSGLYPSAVAREFAARAERTPDNGPGTLDWTRRARRRASPIDAPRVHPDWTRYPYPFLPGQPELKAFPARGWARAVAEALHGPHLAHSIRDSSDRDDPLLVEMIRSEILVPRGVVTEADTVLVTHGAQEALSLVADVMFGPGVTVAVENPGYRDAAHIVAESGATLDLVPVDREGARVPRSARFDYLYLTPSHQHPTSVTLSYLRRLDILRRAQREDFVVIEDDYDSEMRFRGRPTPSLKSLDTEGRVIYVGTFSKFVAPGIRLGFVVAPPELIALLRRRRRYANRHPSGHTQRALALFIQSGDYHRALRRHRNHLLDKWGVLTESLAAHLPWPLETPTAGGTSLWVTGDAAFDGTAVAHAAEKRGVLIDPGSAFHLGDDGPRNHIRLGFNAIPLAAIRPGVALLGEVIRDLE